MDKVAMKLGMLSKATLITVIFHIVASCSSINMVAVKNDTDETIMFRGKFEYKPNPPYNMDFTLRPGENNLWKYEIGYLEKSIIDKGLQKITLTNDSECTVILEREAIEKRVIKQGPWILIINRDIMNCN